MENFKLLKIEDSLKNSLNKMNFTKPTPIQSMAIPVALEGKDILGTGGGILNLMNYSDEDNFLVFKKLLIVEHICFSLGERVVLTAVPPAWKFALILFFLGTLKTAPFTWPFTRIILLSPLLKFFRNF